MRFNKLFNLALILGLLFITLGDRILPQPLNEASRNTRTSINQFFIGLFPDWQPKNPNQRTKDAADRLEKGDNQQ